MPKTLDYWHDAKRHLSRSDDVLSRIIKSYEGERLSNKRDAFHTLARSIVGQQISLKAADTIWGRFEECVGEIAPAHVLKAKEPALRACGLSGQKTIYLRSLAEHFDNDPAFSKQMKKMEDEEVIKSLTSIKGIGRWTAEMFLIFHLERPDVLPLADIGLQRAIEKHYGKGRRLPAARMQKIAKPWQPYRSVATWYLWRSLDPVPVAY